MLLGQTNPAPCKSKGNCYFRRVGDLGLKVKSDGITDSSFLNVSVVGFQSGFSIFLVHPSGTPAIKARRDLATFLVPRKLLTRAMAMSV